MNNPTFPPEEFERRLRAVRQSMSEDGLDALLVSTPENVYYLSGLDHMGYFAYQMLIVPLTGTPVLVTRAMEAATVRDQVPNLVHYGYADGSRPLPPAPESDTAERVDLEQPSAAASWPNRRFALPIDLPVTPRPLPKPVARWPTWGLRKPLWGSRKAAVS
jgi:Xaa-Pro aminopeptidase